jgi:hypothetical protein
MSKADLAASKFGVASLEYIGIYHPAHTGLFATPEAYLAWYER